MAIKYLSGIDLNGNSLSNAPVQNLATEPAVATFDEGQMYFNTTNDKLYVLADGAFVDLTSQGDITAVALKATGNTGVQLEIANTGGPIPTFEILTGAVADGQNYLVDSQAVFNAISSSGGGTVTSVDGSGGTTGLTLTGGAITASGTLTLGGTLIPANGGTGQTAYTVGDILYASSTTALSKLGIGSAGQVLKVTSGVPAWAADANAGGTVTSIAFGDGLTGGTITGSGSVALNVSGTGNYILQGNNDTGATLEEDFKIPYSDASNVVQFGNVSDFPFTSNVGTVTSVATGDAATITIAGTAAAPTVAAVTAAIAASGTGLATADQINTFVTDFNYSTTVGTVTSVTAGTGMTQTGVSTVNPTLNVIGGDGITAAANEITVDSTVVRTAGAQTIAGVKTFSSQVSIPTTPVASTDAASKNYVDSSNVGQLVFQGGYDATASAPTGAGVLQGFTYVVTVAGDDGGFWTVPLEIGDLIVANQNNPVDDGDWTEVNKNVTLASTTIAGIASFSADNFAVSAAGAVTIKDNGVILGTETTGAYVSTLATGTGLDNTTGTGEGSTPTVSLDFSELTRAAGNEFIMLTDGESVPKKSTPAQAAGVLNSEVTFAATITATGTVTHNLGTEDVIVQLYDVTNLDTVYADVVRTSVNVVTVTFSATPANDVRVLVQKIG